MSGWLERERSRAAAERILDAAAGLFAERGVTTVGMGEVATAAGCSRATLYRYFADRGELHLAFVQREAVRIGALVAADLRAAGEEPVEQVAAGVLSAIQHVRSVPAVAAWFRDDAAGHAAAIAQSSEVIAALGLAVVDDPEAAAWLVRSIVSLLTVPAVDEDAERRLVERFVAPAVVSPEWAAPAGSARTRGPRPPPQQ